MTPSEQKQLVKFVIKFLNANNMDYWNDNFQQAISFPFIIDEQMLFYAENYAPILMHLGKIEMKRLKYCFISAYHPDGGYSFKFIKHAENEREFLKLDNEFMAFWSAVELAEKGKNRLFTE